LGGGAAQPTPIPLQIEQLRFITHNVFGRI
jgi:hypothetical protein